MQQKRTLLFYLLFSIIALGTALIHFFSEEAKQNVSIHLSVRNNLWSHYGTKSIKSKLYEVEKNHLNFVTQDITDPGQLSVKNILMANLDREIARYKKEQNDIQREALQSDTRFELAKRKQLFSSIALSISLFSLLNLVGAFMLKIENIAPKIVSVTTFLAALGLCAYAIFFM